MFLNYPEIERMARLKKLYLVLYSENMLYVRFFETSSYMYSVIIAEILKVGYSLY